METLSFIFVFNKFFKLLVAKHLFFKTVRMFNKLKKLLSVYIYVIEKMINIFIDFFKVIYTI